jgi:hypothetical protein
MAGFSEGRRAASVDQPPPARYTGAAQRRFEAGWRAGQSSWLREEQALASASRAGLPV